MRLRDIRRRRAGDCPRMSWHLLPKSDGFEILGGIVLGKVCGGGWAQTNVPTKSLITPPTSLTWLNTRAGRCSGVRSGCYKNAISLARLNLLTETLCDDTALTVIDVVVAPSS